jgi:hypothetical protein
VYDLAEQGAGAHAFVGLLSLCQLVFGRWLRAATHYADSRLAGFKGAIQCLQNPGTVTWLSREQLRLCGDHHDALLYCKVVQVVVQWLQAAVHHTEHL